LQAQPAPARNAAIPDFSSGAKAWVLAGGPVFRKVPGDTGPGPVVSPAGKEYKFGEQNAVADTSTPILKPWAKKLMDIANQRVEAGGVPFVDDSRCWPGGVPSLLLFPGEAVVFLQTPTVVYFLSKRDAQIRRIYLNAPHSANPGYSWKGESVGHYENGDTLVVDTIGLDDKGPLDRFRTPHTKQMHVIERYKLVGGGKGIDVTFTVDDPGTFTTPWKALVQFKPGDTPRSNHWEEDICAENGDGYGFDPEQLVPMPRADKPEF
jgi:hypothetical protein